MAMVTEVHDREYCREQIDHYGIYRCRPGETLPPKCGDIQYTRQFYLRRVLYNPTFLRKVSKLLVEKLDLNGVQFGACEDAGVALAVGMSLCADVPMISIKKQRKAYGLHNLTEGPLSRDPVLLVDDLAGSQQTLRSAQNLLTRLKIPCAKQYATIVNKTENTHPEAYLNRELVSIFTCADFAMSWDQYIDRYGREPNFGRWA